jgi:hypothetical protein
MFLAQLLHNFYTVLSTFFIIINHWFFFSNWSLVLIGLEAAMKVCMLKEESLW